MGDPDEGIGDDGTTTTGARRDRVPEAFEPVLIEAAAAADRHGASLYVYGSVANGTARLGASDVDLLSIGLPHATKLGRRLSALFADRCRGVEIAGAEASSFAGEGDEAYGGRVFLRHYCVHLAGPDHATGLPRFPADARAARGFNGDIGRHLSRWRDLYRSGAEPADALGVRTARKTLLAVAAMVSVHDRTWTTDRSRAAQRWSAVHPELADGLALLHAWTTGKRRPADAEVEHALGDAGLVAAVVEQFDRHVGLWA